MNKYIFFVFTFLYLFLNSNGFAENFSIEEYNVDIRINHEKATLEIKEELNIFFKSPSHGIFRIIPLKYQAKSSFKENMLSFNIYIYDVKVEGEKFEKSKRRNELIIKIGDPKMLLTGQKRYLIKYKVYGAFVNFDNYSHLYWNVVGKGWNTNMERVNFFVFLPKGVSQEDVKASAFLGKNRNEDRYVLSNFESGMFYGRLSNALPSQESLSLELIFPPHVIKDDDLMLKIGLHIRDRGILFLPIFLIFGLGLVWFFLGRDEKVASVVYYYPPEDVTPAEAGVLIDDKSDNRDITSLLFYWASKGYMTIEEVPDNTSLFEGAKDYLFTKKSDLPEDAKIFEKILFYGLFPQYMNVRRLCTLKEEFFPIIVETRKALDCYLNKSGLYVKTSRWLGNALKTSALISLVAGIVMFLRMKLFDYGIIFIVSSIILFVFGVVMPKKTKKGNENYRKIKGFKNFLERVEKPRLEKLMKDYPDYFNKILPYAMVFGVENMIVRKFEGLYNKPPDWYKKAGVKYTTNMDMLLSFNMAMKTMNQIFTSNISKERDFSDRDSGGGSW